MPDDVTRNRSLRSVRSLEGREHLDSVLFLAEQTQHQFMPHAAHDMWSHRSLGHRSSLSQMMFLGSQPQRVDMTPQLGQGLYRSTPIRSEFPDEFNNFQFKLSWLLKSGRWFHASEKLWRLKFPIEAARPQQLQNASHS
jgi:hypothetical protein